MRSTRLYIDMEKIKANISEIKQYIPSNTEIMPIVKCNGYGTHLNKFIEVISQFKYIGVALVDEGIILRESGYKGNIFVLYPPTKEELDDIQEHDLFFNGCDIEMLEYFNEKTDKSLTIHIEIETGMGRTGVSIKDVHSYTKRLKKLRNIKVDGVYSHLSSSSSDMEFSKQQIDKFKDVLEIFDNESVSYNYVHIFNSGAIFNFKDPMFNMVRIGILIYGYFPNNRFKKLINLYPSMVLKSKISFVKELDIGDTVGYNQNFIAKRKSVVATIPFGFGDGFIGLEARELYNPYVIINGLKCKIIGICMDNMMIDVTDISNVKTGDEVIIFDNEQLTVEEVAEWCNGICNYEIISSISDRIPRVFN